MLSVALHTLRWVMLVIMYVVCDVAHMFLCALNIQIWTKYEITVSKHINHYLSKEFLRSYSVTGQETSTIIYTARHIFFLIATILA